MVEVDSLALITSSLATWDVRERIHEEIGTMAGERAEVDRSLKNGETESSTNKISIKTGR